MPKFRKKNPLASAQSDAKAAKRVPITPQTQSPAYKLAFQDDRFLLLDELRPIRLQLELLKPEMALKELRVDAAVVIFGSARIKDKETAEKELELIKRQHPHDIHAIKVAERHLANSCYYEEARKLAAYVSKGIQDGEPHDKLYVMTGGGPGIMEAANRGASEVGEKSVGLNIVLPFEQCPNRDVTPELCFSFHYFAIRKMHLLLRARALVAFPGGFGTLDELFETLTLMQTRKIKMMPVILIGKAFWQKIVNWQVFVDEQLISAEDLKLLHFVDKAEEAWALIREWQYHTEHPEETQTIFASYTQS